MWKTPEMRLNNSSLGPLSSVQTPARRDPQCLFTTICACSQLNKLPRFPAAIARRSTGGVVSVGTSRSRSSYGLSALALLLRRLRATSRSPPMIGTPARASISQHKGISTHLPTRQQSQSWKIPNQARMIKSLHRRPIHSAGHGKSYPMVAPRFKNTEKDRARSNCKP